LIGSALELKIRLLGENLANVHDGKEPGCRLLIIDTADFKIFENAGMIFMTAARDLIHPPSPLIPRSVTQQACLRNKSPL
jgi:hypothetical protein